MPGLFARLFGSSKSKPARVTKPASPRKPSITSSSTSSSAPPPKRASVSSLAPPSAAAAKPPGIELDSFGPLRLDQPVIVNGSTGLVIARVRYVGTIDGEGPAQMVGVEYEAPIGKCNGTINGREYFSCAPNRGDFVMRQFVAGVTEKDPTTAIFLLSKKLQEKDERQKARETLNQSVWSVLDTHRENHVVHARNIYKKLKELREKKKAAQSAASGIPDATRPRSRSLPNAPTVIPMRPVPTLPPSVITSPLTSPPANAAATSTATAGASSTSSSNNATPITSPTNNTTVTSPVGITSPTSPPGISMTIAVSPPTPSSSSSSHHSAAPSIELTAAEELELLELPPANDPLFLENQASVMWDKDELRPFSEPVSLQYVLNLIRHFRDNRLMEVPDLWKLLKCATRVLSESENIVTLPIFPKITVIGDLHGQLPDLFYIFNHNDLPSEANPYLFNGDFVDRGQHSCEVLLILLVLKLAYPKYVYLNRGNHEATTQNVAYGFKDEVCNKYGEESFDYFLECFAQMPIAHVIQGKILVVHGGICITQSFNDLRAIPKQLRGYYDPHEPGFPPGYIEMLWNDPQPEEGFKPSERMTGYTWGPDYTRRFCDDNKISYVIRAHELRLDTSQNMNGWLLEHNGQMLTVFSASNYGGAAGNYAAFAIVRSPDELPELVTYFADTKEDFSPHRAHRNSVIEEDIIYQLCEAIAGHRQALLTIFQAMDTKGTGIVTRIQCEAALQEALKLRLPFMAYSEGLSLGKSRKNEVPYISWLDRFRPVHSTFTPMHVGAPGESSAPTSAATAAAMGADLLSPSAPNGGLSLLSPSSGGVTTGPNGVPVIIPPSPAGVLRKRLRVRAMIVAWLGTGSAAAQPVNGALQSSPPPDLSPEPSPTPSPNPGMSTPQRPFAAINAAKKEAAAASLVAAATATPAAAAPLPLPSTPPLTAATTPAVVPMTMPVLPAAMNMNIPRTPSLPTPVTLPAGPPPSARAISSPSPSTSLSQTVVEPVAIPFMTRPRSESLTPPPSTPPALLLNQPVPTRPVTFALSPPAVAGTSGVVAPTATAVAHHPVVLSPPSNPTPISPPSSTIAPTPVLPQPTIVVTPPPAVTATTAATASTAASSSSSSSASSPNSLTTSGGASATNKRSPTSAASAAPSTQAISDFLYKHRMTLETYFHDYDKKKNGLITPDDFEHAVVELNGALPNPLTSAQIKDLLISFCLLDESQRSYINLFRGFEFADPELRERTRKWKLAPAGATPASPQVQPGVLLPNAPIQGSPILKSHNSNTAIYHTMPPLGRQGSFELGTPPASAPDPIPAPATTAAVTTTSAATTSPSGEAATIGVVNLPSALLPTIPRSQSAPTNVIVFPTATPPMISTASNGSLFGAPPVAPQTPPTMFRPISFGTPTPVPAASHTTGTTVSGTGHATTSSANGSSALFIGTLTPPQATRTISGGNTPSTPPSASSPNLFAASPNAAAAAATAAATHSSSAVTMHHSASHHASPALAPLSSLSGTQPPPLLFTTSLPAPTTANTNNTSGGNSSQVSSPPSTVNRLAPPIVVTIRRNSSPLINSPFVRAPSSATSATTPGSPLPSSPPNPDLASSPTTATATTIVGTTTSSASTSSSSTVLLHTGHHAPSPN